jgi:hypothetical protein
LIRSYVHWEQTAYRVWRDRLVAYDDISHSSSKELIPGDIIIPVGLRRFGMINMLGVLVKGHLLFVTQFGFDRVCRPIV